MNYVGLPEDRQRVW